MNSETIARVTELLTDQCSLLYELATVARRQQQALLSGDQAGVESTTKVQEELLGEVHVLEAERIALLGAVTLEELIADAPTEQQRSTLVELRDEARTRVDELTALNETNAQLLKQELALVGLYMSVLSPDGTGEVYGDPAYGKRQQGGAPVAFDTRA